MGRISGISEAKIIIQDGGVWVGLREIS